jgi:hypothetical protein
MDALFSDLKIAPTLLVHSSMSFDYDAYLKKQTEKPNFFIFYSNDPNYEPKYKSYIGVEELRKAISKFIIENDSISTIFIAFNPSGNKTFEEISVETTTPIIIDEPVVKSPIESNKKQKDRPKISTVDSEITEKAPEIKTISIEHKNSTNVFTWDKIDNAKEIRINIMPTANAVHNDPDFNFIRTDKPIIISGKDNSYAYNKVTSGSLSSKHHIFQLEAIDNKGRKIAEGIILDCQINCEH